MPPRSPRLRIGDILAAIERIDRYTGGLTCEEFEANDLVVDGVLRNLTVIGEAATTLPQEFTTTHPEIPWSEMVGMRNVVVHAYFGTNLEIVWETITSDLPPLVPLLRALL